MTATIRTIRLHPTSHPGSYASAAISLTNLERYTRDVVDWPTPIMSDDELEFWARCYHANKFPEAGIRFIFFLQCRRFWLERRLFWL